MTIKFVAIAKILLAIINFFYFFIGISFFVLLIIQAVIAKKFQISLSFLMIVTVITAFLIVIISISGCFITCKENKNLILTYAIFVLIAMVLQFIVILLTIREVNANNEKIIKELLTSYRDLNTDTQMGIQRVQTKFECCGYNSWADYKLPIYYLPNSCCGKLYENYSRYQIGQCQPNEIYKKGCEDKFLENGRSPKLTKPAIMHLFFYVILQIGAVALSFGMLYSMKQDEAVKFQQTQNVIKQF